MLMHVTVGYDYFFLLCHVPSFEYAHQMKNIIVYCQKTQWIFSFLRFTFFKVFTYSNCCMDIWNLKSSQCKAAFLYHSCWCLVPYSFGTYFGHKEWKCVACAIGCSTVLNIIFQDFVHMAFCLEYLCFWPFGGAVLNSTCSFSSGCNWCICISAFDAMCLKIVPQM